MVAGAAWLALAGHMLVGSLAGMLEQGLSFNASAVKDFDPAARRCA